jgi:hypothetical protein
MKWFFKQKLNYFGPIIIFSPIVTLSINDIQVWNINTWTTNENGYKLFLIYLSSNHGWISSNDKWNSSIWNHSSMDTFIHVRGVKSH